MLSQGGESTKLQKGEIIDLEMIQDIRCWQGPWELVLISYLLACRNLVKGMALPS